MLRIVKLFRAGNFQSFPCARFFSVSPMYLETIIDKSTRNTSDNWRLSFSLAKYLFPLKVMFVL